jgi:hypothetical protein
MDRGKHFLQELKHRSNILRKHFRAEKKAKSLEIKNNDNGRNRISNPFQTFQMKKVLDAGKKLPAVPR